VYKLVEINGRAKMKLSQDVEKVTMPGKKQAFRLYGNDGRALIDLMQRPGEQPPEEGKRVLCRHPFQVCYVSGVRMVFWKKKSANHTADVCSILTCLIADGRGRNYCSSDVQHLLSTTTP
jgi:nicotinate phosphoribosyltransferase